MKKQYKKVVLAYSGGLDTSIIIPWLKENYGCEVIAVAGNVGQGDELDGLEAKVMATGASKLYVEDLRRTFVEDYIWPTLKAGAKYETYLLGTSFARPPLAKRLVEIAKAEGAEAICHGCTGKGNDQVRFDPSCLIELGFITTPAEEQFLNTDEGVANMGRGIYLAFCDYLRKYDKSITVPFKPGTPERDVQEALGKERNNADIRDKSDKPDDKGKSDDDKVKPDDDKVKPDDDAPVFKVQVTTSNVRLKAGHRQLKGVSDFDVYQDGGLYKYTVGSSCDYNEIYRLRKTLLDKFPEAFIIAFKNGARVNVQEAIREFKSRKHQR